MFELPQNQAEELRTEVIDALVEAIFWRISPFRGIDHSDKFINMGTKELRREVNSESCVRYTQKELNAALDVFKAKGYHAFKRVKYTNGYWNWYIYITEQQLPVTQDGHFLF